jgi:Protein of unknown function (DUF3667)
MQNIICKNCNNHFAGKFCNTCGEKVYNENDKTIKSLLKEALHFLTHFEGSLFVTIKTLLLKQGKLSLDYCNGIRKKYFKPVSFFLVCIILYLLFPKFTGLNMKFAAYVNEGYNYSWYSLPVAKEKIKHLNITGNQLAEKYDAKSSKFAKPFLLILLPLSSILMWCLYFKRRRFFFDHFIIATEVTTFIFAFSFLIMPVIMILITAAFPSSGYLFKDDGLLLIISLAILICATFAALKRFYQEKWWVTLIKSCLFVFIYNFIIQGIYKMILYFVIMFFI